MFPDDSDALLRFAGEMLTPWPESIGDAEGLQEIAERAGLIEPHELSESDFVPELGDSSNSFDGWGIGDTIFFLTPLGQSAIDAAEQARAAA